MSDEEKIILKTRLRIEGILNAIKFGTRILETGLEQLDKLESDLLDLSDEECREIFINK